MKFYYLTVSKYDKEIRFTLETSNSELITNEWLDYRIHIEIDKYVFNILYELLYLGDKENE